MADRSQARTDEAPSRSSGSTPMVVAGLLLGVAIVVPLLVPTYARDTPRLWGFPFFYWYQLLWVFLCAGLVTIAHRLVRQREARKREELGLGPRHDPDGGDR